MFDGKTRKRRGFFRRITVIPVCLKLPVSPRKLKRFDKIGGLCGAGIAQGAKSDRISERPGCRLPLFSNRLFDANHPRFASRGLAQSTVRGAIARRMTSAPGAN
jgi:hypothetical protein